MYQIVIAFLPENLETDVNKLIADGWKPIGGVSVSVEKYNTKFMQSMVKYEGEYP